MLRLGYCGLLAICISNIVTMVFLMTSTSLDLLGQTHYADVTLPGSAARLRQLPVRTVGPN